MKSLLISAFVSVLVLMGCTPSSPTDPGKPSNQDYYPTTVGSKWVYKDQAGNTVTTEHIGTSEKNGKTYTTSTQVTPSESTIGYVRNDGSTVFSITGNIDGNEIPILEYSGGAGHAWSYIINVNGTLNEYKMKIRAIGTTKTVTAGTYNDVLIADLDQTSSFGGIEYSIIGVYYFSKKYGLLMVEFTGLLNRTLEATAITIK
jgi:hypothetical protein